MNEMTREEARTAFGEVLARRAGEEVTIGDLQATFRFRTRPWIADLLHRAASGDDDLFPGLVIHHGNGRGRYEIERQTSDVVTPSERKSGVNVV